MLEGRRNAAASASDSDPDAIPEFEASLPGCVHTALIRAGRIGDPRLAQNELTQQWVGTFDWVWRTSIEVTAEVVGHALHELVIDGLDTVARVIVSGFVSISGLP